MMSIGISTKAFRTTFLEAMVGFSAPFRVRGGHFYMCLIFHIQAEFGLNLLSGCSRNEKEYHHTYSSPLINLGKGNNKEKVLWEDSRFHQ